MTTALLIQIVTILTLETAGAGAGFAQGRTLGTTGLGVEVEVGPTGDAEVGCRLVAGETGVVTARTHGVAVVHLLEGALGTLGHTVVRVDRLVGAGGAVGGGSGAGGTRGGAVFADQLVAGESEVVAGGWTVGCAKSVD